MRLIVFFLLLILWTACNKENAPSVGTQTIHSVKYFKVKDSIPAVPESALDTFTSWKQLVGYFHIKDSITEEELKDRLELISGGLQRIKQRPFPVKLNKVEIKSRLLALENEVYQLRWVLKKEYVSPSPDSLFRRLLDAYAGLVIQIKQHSAEKENFEEIFKAKQERDSLLLEKLKKETEVSPGQE